MKPEGENVFAGDDASRCRSCSTPWKGLDDVQEIYTTAVIEDE
jgi:hypothetical protein